MPPEQPLSFRSQPLADLARQLQFAPPGTRAEQVRRTERLHDEIEPERSYPLDFLVFRITGYRRDWTDGTLLVGEAARPDLRLMIDRLSRSIELPQGTDEPSETVGELAERLGVSRKTITRWRKAGLRWRWEVPPGRPRPQVVITESGLKQFQADQGERVEQASRFSQLSRADRDRLIARARKLASATDASFNQVATHLARRTGRAVETVRQLLAAHDREHPEDPIFRDRTGPLTPRQKRVIARAHRMGIPVSRLARRFDRTRSTIYRAIHERRAAEARRHQIKWMTLPTFDREEADAIILRPHPEEQDLTTAVAAGADVLPEPLPELFRQPVLSPEGQRSLLVRYNYLKYKASQICRCLDRYEPRAADLDAFEQCLEQARQLRSLLVRANLATVLSVARRNLLGDQGLHTHDLLHLLETGHGVLLDAVDECHPGRTADFSGYLRQQLLRRFAVDSDREQAHRRLRPAEAYARLIDQAKAAGVDLIGRPPGSVNS